MHVVDLSRSGQLLLTSNFEKSDGILDMEKLLIVFAGKLWFNDIALETVPLGYSTNAVTFASSIVLTLFSEKVIVCPVELYLQFKNSNWATLHCARVVFSVGSVVETNVELQ